MVRLTFHHYYPNLRKSTVLGGHELLSSYDQYQSFPHVFVYMLPEHGKEDLPRQAKSHWLNMHYYNFV